MRYSKWFEMQNIILSGQIPVEKWWLGTPDYDVDGVCHSDDNIYLAPEKSSHDRIHRKKVSLTEIRSLIIK